jgi:hypothetical protein
LLRLFATKDRGVYLVCYLLGWVVYLAARPAFWAPQAASLVTYHLFLAFLIFGSPNGRARRYNLLATAASHLVFVALLIGLRMAVVSQYASFVHSQPAEARLPAGILAWRLLSILLFAVRYGLAVLEFKALFGAEESNLSEGRVGSESAFAPAKMKPVPVPVHRGGPLVAATGADHYEFLQHYRNMGPYEALGQSPEAVYEKWLRARGKTQYPVIPTVE